MDGVTILSMLQSAGGVLVEGFNIVWELVTSNILLTFVVGTGIAATALAFARNVSKGHI